MTRHSFHTSRATRAFRWPALVLAVGSLAAGLTTGPHRDIAFAHAVGTPGRLNDHAAHSATSKPPFRFFSPTSFWNEEVPVGAAIDPHSAEVISAFLATIDAEEQAKNGPWINTTAYSIPIYEVPASQPVLTVHLSGSVNPALSAAWHSVPLPKTAEPAAGTDGDLMIWQPSTNKLWEFWRLVHGATGWHASWGGAMDDVSTAQGAYGPEAWPDAQTSWGISASSMSLAGGLITLEDLADGEIDHALEMAIPGIRSGVFASPAQRSDGRNDAAAALPEGAHLQLNPALNLESLHLAPFTLMLARAAQRYGIFVTDGSPIATFYAQDPDPTGSNPYAGANGYFDGEYPDQLLATFPWSQLQLLSMELHSTG